MSSKNDETKFDACLSRVFTEMAFVKGKADRNPEDADEFLFHIKDSLPNLRELCELWDNPTNFSDKDVKGIVQGLIYHAVPHLIAAARLYDIVMDTFKEYYLKNERAKRARKKHSHGRVRVKT